MKDRTGEGTMICYAVFPGAYLSYNDFHMWRWRSTGEPLQ